VPKARGGIGLGFGKTLLKWGTQHHWIQQWLRVYGLRLKRGDVGFPMRQNFCAGKPLRWNKNGVMRSKEMWGEPGCCPNGRPISWVAAGGALKRDKTDTHARVKKPFSTPTLKHQITDRDKIGVQRRKQFGTSCSHLHVQLRCRLGGCVFNSML